MTDATRPGQMNPKLPPSRCPKCGGQLHYYSGSRGTCDKCEMDKYLAANPPPAPDIPEPVTDSGGLGLTAGQKLGFTLFVCLPAAIVIWFVSWLFSPREERNPTHAARPESQLASPTTRDTESEGERDGKRYADDLRRRGISPDGTACAIGMAAEDRSRPQYTQAQAESYAKAFGNACMGRKVF